MTSKTICSYLYFYLWQRIRLSMIIHDLKSPITKHFLAKNKLANYFTDKDKQRKQRINIQHV